MVNEYKTLGLHEAALFLKIHPETLRRRALAGEIPSAKPGKSWVFLEADLAQWLRSQYGNRRQASQGEGGNSCHLNDAGRKVFGGSGLPPPMENEYSKALRLPIGGKQKSTKRG
jgi:excisionase family DNA binding protein